MYQYEALQEKQSSSPRIQTPQAVRQLAASPLMQRRRQEMDNIFQPVQRQPDKTGLPDNLKTGMENLSGQSLDHVRVHYNSAKPATVQAHAFAQGSDIHLASGQEKHLPHELGHVVQQMQGRVKATTSVNGVAVNDSVSLESEATGLGERALRGR